jgi:uncharacterized protein (DUF2147 family)
VKSTATLLAASIALLCASATLADGDAILGIWKTEPDEYGYAHVEISEANGKYHGEIVWLSEPEYPPDDEEGMGGQPKVDRNNPDPDSRTQPIVGLKLIKNFEFVGKDQWKRGTVYDPEDGKTYKCIIKLQEDGTLKVRGYIGISLLGRTTHWTRPDNEHG